MLDQKIDTSKPDGAEKGSGTLDLDTVVEGITDVATLPMVAMKVIEIANNPKSGATDLKAAVEGDVSLSARVLRTVNSAAYCPRTKITNLLQAISYLGFRQIRNLALTASVRSVFKDQEGIGTYKQTELWRHLVAVGICSRMIAMRVNLKNFEDAYLAGLLHDFGIILEDQHLNPYFKRLMHSLDGKKTLEKAEAACMGFDHTVLGFRMGEKWKFPSTVQAAIQFHHMTDEYRGEEITIVRCVELANFICALKNITSIGINLVKPPLSTIEALGFNKEDIKLLVTDLDVEIKQRTSLFTL
jgi:HD-like signal output (HDOD) protein